MRQPDLQQEFTQAYNDPNTKIIGGRNDFTNKFNNPSIMLPEISGRTSAKPFRSIPGLVDAYNDPNIKIAGSNSGFIGEFNDPSVRLPSPKPFPEKPFPIKPGLPGRPGLPSPRPELPELPRRPGLPGRPGLPSPRPELPELPRRPGLPIKPGLPPRVKIDWSSAPTGTPAPTKPLPTGAIGWFWDRYGNKWAPNYQRFPQNKRSA